MADVLKGVLTTVAEYVELGRLHVNELCRGLEPWQVILFTFSCTLVAVWTYNFLFQQESIKKRFMKWFFTNIKRIPMVKARIDREMVGTKDSMLELFSKGITDGYLDRLPAKGLGEKRVLEEIKEYKSLVNVDWKTGSCSGTVYSGEDRLSELMAKVYGEFAWTNPLHPEVFPDIRKMEAEVVRMTCTMFNGSKDSCGSMTSGGTESILLACKSYRDRAYEERGVKYPEILAPITVHAAFDKAAQYFKMKIVHVPINEKTRQVDTKAMKRAINSNTCVLVGSAPSFPHGIIDPIGEIAALGRRYGVPVHVDACLGGFLIPFMEKAGFPLDPFDFRVPGVTSISADHHKFGYAPKGSSCIMYSNANYRRYQFFVQPDWTGGIYASPTFAGSRAGAIIAACWATLMCIGENGYVDFTRKVVKTTLKIASALEKVPGLKVYGEPRVCVVGIGSDEFNIYRLSEGLTAKGWNLNPLQFPSSIHICCTLLHTKQGVAARFIRDVQDVAAVIMKDPKAKVGGQAAIYGMAQSIPDRSLVSEIAASFFDAYYDTTDTTKRNGKHK